MPDRTRMMRLCSGRRAEGWRLRFVALVGYVLLGAGGMSGVVGANEPAVDAAASSPEDLTPVQLLNDLESTGREKQARLNRLRHQLQKLAAASRSPAPPAAAVVPPMPEPPDESPLEPQHENAHGETPPPPLADPHAVPEPPVEHGQKNAIEPPAGHNDAHAPAAHSTDSGHHGPADVPHGPGLPQASETLPGVSIDRTALADSLFGNGQSDLALQAYNSIDLLKQPIADRYWIEYQIANCHRRLGDLPEAERRYRRLAGLVDAGWCAVHARWWLDALSTRVGLQRDLEAIRTTLKTVEEQLHAQSQQ